ncbi:hypothetical protein [Hasllibacter sp. MH4015]|uniref:hypothetical protein n=1 Tax=Hasllibacter sp. MH4015 TaxID=2854029 RepID=UPI001CD2054C|nr:hypothetical protein [Hasllibacter sp. MH4015]
MALAMGTPSDKEVALKAGLDAFESAMRPWLSPRSPLSPLVIEATTRPAPQVPPMRRDPMAVRQTERSADQVLISSGAGPRPDQWQDRQFSETIITVHSDEVWLSYNAMHTVFIRGWTIRALTFNGLLRARFEQALLRGLQDRLIDVSKPKHRQGGGTMAGLAGRRNRTLVGPRLYPDSASQGEGFSPNLRLELGQKINGVLRTTPEILGAQRIIWGGDDPNPTPWFP